MRSTVVPAQITTVEDRVAGNLGISQLLLLLVPVFSGALLYIILPPFFAYSSYKVVLLTILSALCIIGAIRIKGQILLLWLIAIARYNLRPRYFVYDKNNMHGREVSVIRVVRAAETVRQVKQVVPRLQKLATPELVKVEELLANPQAHVRFSTSPKGELRVHVTESA